MINTTTLIGRLTKRPESKVIKRKGKEPLSVCNVRLAVNATEDTAYFIPVTFFGKIADVVCEYCDKGDKIAVNGYLKSENWEDNEGKSRSRIIVIANTVEFMTKSENGNAKCTKSKRDEEYEESFYYNP